MLSTHIHRACHHDIGEQPMDLLYRCEPACCRAADTGDVTWDKEAHDSRFGELVYVGTSELGFRV